MLLPNENTKHNNNINCSYDYLYSYIAMQYEIERFTVFLIIKELREGKFYKLIPTTLNVNILQLK